MSIATQLATITLYWATPVRGRPPVFGICPSSLSPWLQAISYTPQSSFYRQSQVWSPLLCICPCIESFISTSTLLSLVHTTPLLIHLSAFLKVSESQTFHHHLHHTGGAGWGDPHRGLQRGGGNVKSYTVKM